MHGVFFCWAEKMEIDASVQWKRNNARRRHWIKEEKDEPNANVREGREECGRKKEMSRFSSEKEEDKKGD